MKSYKALKNKSIMIQSASQDMGATSARARAEAGAAVIATDVSGALPTSLDGVKGIEPWVRDVTNQDRSFGFDFNVTSMVRMCRAFIPGMLRRGESEGSAPVLNMASMASSGKGFINRAIYGATKAAVIGMTKAIAPDFVARILRCNALCPGTVDDLTPTVLQLLSAGSRLMTGQIVLVGGGDTI